jgi:outer membrane receptor protein involved in Fe transport
LRQSASGEPLDPAYELVFYFDLTGTWQATEQIGVTVAILNVFDEEPPVLGNEAGTTASNSGNTFPSMYNTLGTMYTAGFRVQF